MPLLTCQWTRYPYYLLLFGTKLLWFTAFCIGRSSWYPCGKFRLGCKREPNFSILWLHMCSPKKRSRKSKILHPESPWPLAAIVRKFNQGLVSLSFAEKDQGSVLKVSPYPGQCLANWKMGWSSTRNEHPAQVIDILMNWRLFAWNWPPVVVVLQMDNSTTIPERPDMFKHRATVFIPETLLRKEKDNGNQQWFSMTEKGALDEEFNSHVLEFVAHMCRVHSKLQGWKALPVTLYVDGLANVAYSPYYNQT